MRRVALLPLLFAAAVRAQVVEVVSDATAHFAWSRDEGRSAMRSNAVRATFGAPLSFALMEQRQLSLPAGSVAELSHRLVNLGSAPLRFGLHAVDQVGDAFDLAELQLVHDANANDRVDAGEIALSPDEPVALAPGEHIDLVVCGRVPMATVAGMTSTVALVATDLDTDAVLVRINTVVAQALPAGAGLLVEKTASRREAEVGETVDYTVRIRNVSDVALAGVALRDELPRGFGYVSGSLHRDRAALADPVDAGRGVFTVSLGDLAANAVTTLRYRARVGPLALGGDGINRAQATAAGYASNIASARVEARAGVFTDKGVIIGKVFLDSSGDGAQQSGESGVPGVRVYLEDGTYAVSDADGKFSFYGIAPRTHVLKLDPLTLPTGTEPTLITTRQAGDAGSRFVDLRRHELHQANFALRATGSSVTAEIAARRARLLRTASETDRQIKVRLTPDGEPLPVADPKALPAAGMKEEVAAEVTRLASAPTPSLLTSAATVDRDANLASLDPAPGFVDLRDGETLPVAQTDVRVKGSVGAKFTLAVNGQVIGPEQVGRVVRIDARGVEVWTFVGVNLTAGENRLRLLVTDPFGNPRESAALRVLAPGALARINLTAPDRAIADGLTPASVTVELRDARGTPVTTRTALTLTATTGRWLADDLDPALAGLQVFVEGGRATFALVPPLEPGECDVTVTSGAVRDEATFSFAPNLRPMIAAGVIEGVLNFGSRGGALLPAGARDGFEEELRAWSVSGGDGRLTAGARTAFFLKGKIRGDMLLTAAYDSDKAKQERLFRDIQPGEYYPVYGDASVRGYDAQSTGRLYVRIDQERSYLLVGDFTTELAEAVDARTARGLSTYQRSLTGAKEHFENDRVKLDAWASRDSTRQIVEEVPANGTSGPYELGSRNARVNCERVEILTRDRDQSSRIVSARPLARFFDYEFEPFTGRLLFKAPVPSLDADLNPISIRITYEVDDGGPSFWTYGTDAQVKLTERLTLGGVFARDDNPTGEYQLLGAGATLRLAERSTLALEAAHSDSAEAGLGRAGRLDFRHKDDHTDAHVYLGQTETNFRNPAALLLPGRTEGGFKVTRKLTPTTSLIAQGVLTDDATRDTRREGVRLDFARSFGAWRAELGGRHSVKTAEASGVSRSTEVNSLRAKLTAPLPKLGGATLYGEYERDVQSRGKELAAIGLDASLPRGGRLYARHEFVASLGGPFELSETEKNHTTVVGVESTAWRDAQMFSEYRAGEEIYGREAEAALGLRNRFALAEGVRASTSFERVTPVAGAAHNESTSVTAALDFERERWRANTRLEVRTSTATDSVLHSLGYARRLSGDWTFLGKTIALRTETSGTAGGVAWQGRAQAGLAWRPARDDRWNFLGKYELRHESDDRATATTARRLAHVFTSDAVFAPNAAWKVSSHYAGIRPAMGHRTQRLGARVGRRPPAARRGWTRTRRYAPEEPAARPRLQPCRLPRPGSGERRHDGARRVRAPRMEVRRKVAQRLGPERRTMNFIWSRRARQRVRVTKGTEPPREIRRAAVVTVLLRFVLPLLLAAIALVVTSRAECVSTACVEVGSRTLAVDNRRSALFNAVTEQLTGAPVNLTPTEWQALANARITLSQIAEQLRATNGNLTDAQLIGTRFTLRELLDAAARAAQAGGNTTAAAALSTLPVDGLAGTVSLGDLVQGSGTGDASLSALDLTSGLLARYAYDYGVPSTTPSTLTGTQLGLGDSVQSVQFSAIVTEPPVFACGPAGTQFRSAGLRMKLGVDLADKNLSSALAAQLSANGVVLPAGVGAPAVSFTQLEFYAIAGRAEGSIAAVDALAQTVTLRARPGVVDFYLGHIDDAVFFDRQQPIRAADLQFAEVGRMQLNVLGTPVTASVRLRSHASGAPAGYETLYYTGPYPETQTVEPDAFFIENLTSSLIANAEFDIVAVEPVALDPATQAAFDQAVAAIRPSLSSTYQAALRPAIEALIVNAVEPALDFTGTGLGEADLTVTGVHLNCGPGPHARLEPDHERSASPGTTVFYAHTFTADAAGTVTFSTTESADPAIAGWSHVLYHDRNANGQIDAGELALTGALTVAAAERVALVAKVFVPANAPFGARSVLALRADFTLAGVAGAAPEALTHTDTTLVGAGATLGLTLAKQVDKTTALPGDVLVYTITYTNQGAAPLREVVIHDTTPAYTRFVSAATSVLPAGFTNATASTPAVGEPGPVSWSFTGELASGASGSVTFAVRVEP